MRFSDENDQEIKAMPIPAFVFMLRHVCFSVLFFSSSPSSFFFFLLLSSSVFFFFFFFFFDLLELAAFCLLLFLVILLLSFIFICSSFPSFLLLSSSFFSFFSSSSSPPLLLLGPQTTYGFDDVADLAVLAFGHHNLERSFLLAAVQHFDRGRCRALRPNPWQEKTKKERKKERKMKKKKNIGTRDGGRGARSWLT